MKPSHAALFSLVLCVSAADRAAAAPLEAREVRTYTSAALGLTVVSGEVELPRGGWEVSAVSPERALDQVQLSRESFDSRQESASLLRKREAAILESGRRPLADLHAVWREFPGRNAGRQPGTLAEALADLKAKLPERHEFIGRVVLGSTPYPRTGAAAAPGTEVAVQGPFFLLPPDVPLLEARPGATRGPVVPVALELRPLLDDGRHWVLLNNGRIERREIDRALLGRHGVQVAAILAGVRELDAPAQTAVRVLRGLLRDPAAGAVRVVLQDAGSGENREVDWGLAGAAPAEAGLLAAWARDRAQGWRLLAEGGAVPVLRSWITLSESLYGSLPPESGGRRGATAPEEFDSAAFTDRTTDVFGLLGGRAALEETLQMQSLGTGARPPDDLLAWWTFDACDGKNAALRAGAEAVVVGPVACVPGAQGSALELAGDAHLEVKTMRIGSGAMTAAAWVRLGADVGPAQTQTLVSMKAPRGKRQDAGWSLGIHGAGHLDSVGNSLGFDYVGGEQSGSCVAAATRLDPGRWHHVAVTVTGGNVALYLDGAAVRSCDVGRSGIPSWYEAPLEIGRCVGGTPEPCAFRGAVDEVRILRRALGAAEVLELHAPPTEPIPVAAIAGVAVSSHPFEELLAGKEGVRLPIADAVPADRFLLWFGKPAAVFPFLEEGGEFLFRAGSVVTRNWVDDDLKGRYLRRLGLTAKQGRKFLQSGEVTELAIVAPDLFFIDGTDVTVLMRVRRPDRVASRLKDHGIALPPGDGLVEKRLGGGRSAWWGRHGDLILAGTSRPELQACLDLAARGGAGSLGRSAELRYMLSQQEPRPETRAIAYFSDGFVRRLTGPAVKIGQLRRLQDRALAVRVTAGALLFRLDRGREERDLSRLEDLGYTPKGLAALGWRLREDLAAVSPAWGTIAEADTLGAHPVGAATPEEARLYKAYVDQYARYWRQYFDPIALRLDDAPGGELALSVFILPLVDSQLYGQVRGMITGAAGTETLRVPRFVPEPVLQLSLNLNESARRQLSGTLGGVLGRYSGVDPRLFELMGPGLHFAVLDADPVLALGNGDVLGAFGSTGGARRFGMGGLGIPALLSALTRPCRIAVELKDPAAALGLLRGAAAAELRSRGRRDFQSEFRQLEGRDAWIHAINVAGVVRLRLGIEVRQGYLVVSNLPWSQPLAVGAIEEEPLRGAALRVAPRSVREGLPGLFTTQEEQNQAASLKGMGALFPLLAAGITDPAEAAVRHAALLGSTPLHPPPGKWSWREGRVASSVYGDARRWSLPAWHEGAEDFGVLKGLAKLSVGMQFEDEGLRALITWAPAK